MKKLLLAAFAVLALFGCKQMQSELEFSEIKGKGSVTGRVFYEATSTSTGKFESQLLPAIGVDVVLEVANVAYTPGAEGNKKYIATTDSAGNYLIEGIPVGQRDIKPEHVTLRIRPFLAAGANASDSVYYELAEDVAPEIKIVANEQTRVEDLTMTLEADALKNRATVKGVVLYDCGLVQNEGVYETAVLPAAGVEVVAYFTQGEGAQEFITKTNANGEYQLTVLVGDEDKIYIYARSFQDKYSESINGEIVTSDVYYRTETTIEADIKAEEIRQAPELVMTKTDVDLRNSGVLSGKILYEAGLFATGSGYEVRHLPAADAEVVISWLDATKKQTVSHLIKTGAEGEYEFIIPLTEGVNELNVTVAPNTYGAHYSYVEEGQIVVDSADFNAAAVSYPVRREEVKFAKDIVLKTTKSDIVAPEGTTVITGVLLYESGYVEVSAGKYETKHSPAADAEVVVKVVGAAADYSIKTDATGTYRITIPATQIFNATIEVKEYRALYSKYREEENKLVVDSAIFQGVTFPASYGENLKPQEVRELNDTLLTYVRDINPELEGNATLSGTILYDAGYKEISKGKYEVQHLPAANVQVIVNICKWLEESASYEAAGTDHVLTTDAKGAYSLNFPVAKDSKVSARIKVDQEFEADYTYYDDETKSLQTEKRQFYPIGYADENRYEGIEPQQDTIARDIVLQYKGEIPEADKFGPALITGTIYFEAGYSKEDGFTSNIKQPLPAVGAEVLVNVAGKDYWLTTDAKGNYNLVVPMDTTQKVKSFKIEKIKDYRAIYTDEYLEKDSFIFVQPDLSAYQADYLQINIGDTAHVDSIVSKETNYGEEVKLVLKWDKNNKIDPPAAEAQRNQKIEISGIIKRDAEERTTDASWSSIYKDGVYYQRGTSTAVDTVYVVLTGSAEGETKEFIYKTTTGSDGKYKLTVDVYDTWLESTSYARYTVKVKAAAGTFTHYYYIIASQGWTREEVAGTWSDVSTSGYIRSYEEGTKSINVTTELTRSFTPSSEALEGVHGIDNLIDYENEDRYGIQLYRSRNPFNW